MVVCVVFYCFVDRVAFRPCSVMFSGFVLMFVVYLVLPFVS